MIGDTMIDKIYIPTVKRVDNQITYDCLPKELQKKVIFVVQAWERDQYHYDNEYLILPEHINLDHPRPLAETRKIIYEHAKDTKYGMFDDDIVFYRRNKKYWGEESNMEKLNRISTEDDIFEMFDVFDKWLDEPNITVTSCWPLPRFPSNRPYENNKAVCSIFFINGKDFIHQLSEFDLTCVKTGQDILFILYLLTNGYGNRTSNEFIFKNISVEAPSRKIGSVIWDNQSFESTFRDHKKIAELFPDFFKVLYDENGNRVPGGFRNFGKVKMLCSKAFKSHAAKSKSLMNFF